MKSYIFSLEVEAATRTKMKRKKVPDSNGVSDELIRQEMNRWLKQLTSSEAKPGMKEKRQRHGQVPS